MKQIYFLFFSVIQGPLVFSQLLYNNNDIITVQDGTTLFAGGSFTNKTATAQFSNNGRLYVTGNLVNEQTSLLAMDSLLFTGTTAQTYTNAASALTVNNITINNAAGLTLNNSLSVSAAGKSDFTLGLINTTATNLLIYNAGALPGTPADASHINGPARWLGTGAFVFPVGSTSFYRQVDVNLTANGSGITAKYYQAQAPAGTLLAPLLKVSQFEYWTLDPLTTATGSVTLNWNDSKAPVGIVTLMGVSKVRVAHLLSGVWNNESGASGGVGTISTGSVTSNAISSWSPFALGTIDLVNAPLPLKFITLSGTVLSNTKRELRWSVMDETPGMQYVVERSFDGSRFNTIGAVAENNSGKNGFTDRDACLGNDSFYYRVTAIDINNRKTPSGIILLRQTASELIKILTNPVNEKILISFGKGMQGHYTANIFSTSGSLLYQQDIIAASNQTIIINRPPQIIPGMYFIRLNRHGGETNNYTIQFK